MTEIIPVEKKRRTHGFFHAILTIDLKRWLAAEEMKSHTRNLIRAYKDLFVDVERSRKARDDFEITVQKLSLTEEKLAKQSRDFLFFSRIYLIVGMILLGYSIYLLYSRTLFLASFVSFVMGVLMLIYAYKENFWHMQISKRKLGCSFHEWLSFTFRRAR
jgi:ABC-type multidrug transport system fused ATPase/permease subunit